MNHEHQLNDIDCQEGPSMIGPALGLATSFCLLAASWLQDVEQILRISALAMTCIASYYTTKAAIKRTKK